MSCCLVTDDVCLPCPNLPNTWLASGYTMQLLLIIKPSASLHSSHGLAQHDTANSCCLWHAPMLTSACSMLIKK